MRMGASLNGSSVGVGTFGHSGALRHVAGTIQVKLMQLWCQNVCRSCEDDGINGGVVDRQGIHEQEDQVLKELRGDVGSTKIARHEANMCRAPLCSSAHQTEPNTWWFVTPDRFFCHDNLIYIPNSNDLQLQVLCYKHDHILSGHPGQNKTVDLICCKYTWPGLCELLKILYHLYVGKTPVE